MAALGFSAAVSATAPLRAQRRAPAAGLAAAAPVTEARVSLRFARFGRKKAPFYRLVAIDSRDRREGKPLEYLGYHNPMSGETSLKGPEIKRWLDIGAQPSDTVRSMLTKALIMTDDRNFPPPKPKQPKAAVAADEE